MQEENTTYFKNLMETALYFYMALTSPPTSPVHPRMISELFENNILCFLALSTLSLQPAKTKVFAGRSRG
jgi:hypothetical protein